MNEQTIEPEQKQESIYESDANLFGLRKMYKATVVFISAGDEQRITLFTQAPGFDLARIIFNGTTWMKDKHGRIVSIAEVNGIWVE